MAADEIGRRQTPRLPVLVDGLRLIRDLFRDRRDVILRIPPARRRRHLTKFIVQGRNPFGLFTVLLQPFRRICRDQCVRNLIIVMDLKQDNLSKF